MELSTFFVIALFSLLLLKWILKRRKLFSTFETLGIPGPKPSFFTGNLSLLTKPYFDVELVEKYGPIFGYYFGAKPILVVADPELLKIVQVKEPHIFHARDTIIGQSSIPHSLARNMVPFIVGRHWKENRDSLTQGYTTSKFKMMNQIINDEIDEAVAKIAKFAENQQTFELEEIYSSLFGHLSMKITFGIKTSTRESESVKGFFESTSRSFLPSFADPGVSLSVCFPELDSAYTYVRTLYERMRNYFNYTSLIKTQEMCDAAIKSRMSNTVAKYTDVLQSMVNAFRKNLTHASESKNFDNSEQVKKSYIQEYDLSSNALYLAITTYNLIRYSTMYGTYELAKSPRVQENLRKEIFEINGDEKHITYENMLKMKYLDQIYNEVLRLHPSAPFFTNRIAAEDYYYKGQLIPKGMTVYVPQLGIYRNAVYFPDPEAFIPERFEDKNKINPYLYQPFGIGPRHCPGMRLSQYIGKITLARMVQAFNFSVEEEVAPEFRFLIYRPKGPVYLKASPII